MIQQRAFEGKNKMLKGGLHCHTTRSVSGKDTPEEVIRQHYKLGYDFLAITDHRIYNFKNYAPDVPVTILPGMEFDNTIIRNKGRRVFHTVCIGPAMEDGNGFVQDEILDSGTAQNQEGYQKYLDEFHAKGNLTIHCHPQWSSTPPRYFENLRGNIAMEIRNCRCADNWNMDSDAVYWDEILGQGMRIYGVVTDDGHAPGDYGKGWVMVNADNNINAILEALKIGAFYSSCGPEIYNFYVENDKVVIECSEAEMVRFCSDMHANVVKKSEGKALIRAEFDLKGEYRYIRATVIDGKGKLAWTNPIFLQEA